MMTVTNTASEAETTATEEKAKRRKDRRNLSSKDSIFTKDELDVADTLVNLMKIHSISQFHAKQSKLMRYIKTPAWSVKRRRSVLDNIALPSSSIPSKEVQIQSSSHPPHVSNNPAVTSVAVPPTTAPVKVSPPMVTSVVGVKSGASESNSPVSPFGMSSSLSESDESKATITTTNKKSKNPLPPPPPQPLVLHEEERLLKSKGYSKRKRQELEKLHIELTKERLLLQESVEKKRCYKQELSAENAVLKEQLLLCEEGKKNQCQQQLPPRPHPDSCVNERLLNNYPLPPPKIPHIPSVNSIPFSPPTSPLQSYPPPQQQPPPRQQTKLEQPLRNSRQHVQLHQHQLYQSPLQHQYKHPEQQQHRLLYTVVNKETGQRIQLQQQRACFDLNLSPIEQQGIGGGGGTVICVAGGVGRNGHVEVSHQLQRVDLDKMNGSGTADGMTNHYWNPKAIQKANRQERIRINKEKRR